MTPMGFGAAGDVRRTSLQTGRPVRDSQMSRIGIWRAHRDSRKGGNTLLRHGGLIASRCLLKRATFARHTVSRRWRPVWRYAAGLGGAGRNISVGPLLVTRKRAVLVRIDTTRIRDWASFHDVFAEAFGFAGFYGRNMNAWIDCMTSLGDPADAMTTVHAPKGGVVVLQLDAVDDFTRRCPEQYQAIVECSAFVNWRRLEVGEPAVLALSYYLSSSS
jgi:hypothetical protein